MRQEPFIVRSKRPVTDPIPDCSVGEYVKRGIDLMSPDKIVLIDANTDRKVTKEQLDLQANQVACALVEFGLKQTDIVLFYADNWIEYFVVYLSTIYLGLTTSPIPPANGPYETEKQIAQLNGKILIISRNKLPVIRQLMNDDQFGGRLIASLNLLVVLDEEDDHVTVGLIEKHRNKPKKLVTFQELIKNGNGKRLEKIPYFPITNPEIHHFAIVYTSGTTGLPKGAIQTHRSMIASVESSKYSFAYPLSGGSCFGLFNSFGHISGLTYLIVILTQQMAGVLFSNYSDRLYLEAIERYRINIVRIGTSFCAALYDTDYTKLYDLSSIKLFIHGGMKYPKYLLDNLRSRYRAPIYEQYGATEFLRPVSNQLATYPYGCLGSPSPNVELKIVDLKTGKNLPSNFDGEICLRGPNCFLGYWNNQQATALTIDQDGWYHSGDVGYYDQEGRLYLVDRIKEMIKYKHWSVTPSEIETFLQTHSAVSGACVVGVPHQTEGSHLRAYIQLTKGRSVTKQELINYVKENMGYQKRLYGGVRFVDDFPRTSTGKNDRKYFKKLVQNKLLIDLAPVE